MALLMLGSAITVFVVVHQERLGTQAVNLASEQRSRSQRMARLALRSVEGDLAAAEELAAVAQAFDTTLYDLWYGNAGAGVPRPPAAVKAHLQDIAGMWEAYRRDVQTLVEGRETLEAAQAFATSIEDRTDDLFEACDALVEALNQSHAPPTAITLAMRQRGLSVSIGKLALALANGHMEVIPNLQQEAEAFNHNLQQLHNNDTSGPDKPLVPDAASAYLLAIESRWRHIDEDIQLLGALEQQYRAMQAAAQAIDENSEILWQDSDQVVALFEALAQRRAKTSQFLMLVIPVIFMLASVLVLALISHALLPVRAVAKAAEQIATDDLRRLETALQAMAMGDLSQEVQIETREIAVSGYDELAQMAHLFNQMVYRLQEAGEAFNTSLASLRKASAAAVLAWRPRAWH